MPQEAPAIDKLDSWKEIAAYLGRDVRTVIRWEQRGGLPVYRVPVGQRQAVYAFKHEIDEWLSGSAPGSTQLAAALEIAAGRPDWSHQVASPAEVAHSRPRWLSTRLLVPLGLTVLLSLAVYLVLSLFSPPHVVLNGQMQITGNNTLKTGLVTDGRYLYFGETREGRIVLSRVSVQGGPVQEVATPFVQAEPMGVSHDGRRLLVLAGEGQESERPLWIVPTDGSNPQRVGSLLCHAAAWSPDGTRIAYAFGDSIYLATGDGIARTLLHRFAAIPNLLSWSLDGRRLFSFIRDPATDTAVLWEIHLGGQGYTALDSLVPATLPAEYYGSISIVDNHDDAFVAVADKVWLLRRKRWPWQKGFTLAQLAGGSIKGGPSAVDLTAQRLYLTRELPGTNELDWYDRKSHQFRPFLPGISARDVDFSRDGRWIAWVREPENTLWVGEANGSSPRQIATPGMINVELPRWSPDGKRIAFMAKRSDIPFRIFISTATGGPLLEASPGTDNQGAPTWSPDGHSLVYGRVFCQEEKTCAIREINLDTGENTMVPGSDGLSTARWSPDGRFIAALRTDRHEVYLFNPLTRQWRKLADGANGNDLAWSPDSRTLYASRPSGDRPEVIRISLTDGKSDPAVDLTDFSKLPGRIDSWFAVTPDDSILFMHIVQGHEIYALDYATR